MPWQTRDFLTHVQSNYSQTDVETSNQNTFYKLENELQCPCKLPPFICNHGLILLDQFPFFNILTSALSDKTSVKLNTDLQIIKTRCHSVGQEWK